MKKFLAAALAAFVLGCGGPTQSAECKKWLECVADLTPTVTATNEATFGASGTCWKSSQDAATACTATCKDSLAAAKATQGSPAACQ